MRTGMAVRWAPLMLALVITLAGCTGPYDHALESGVLLRPEEPFTPADHRALAPYLASPYFRDHD